MILKSNQARFLEKLQLRLAKVDRLPQLAILGIVSGLLVGVIIVFFRMFIDYAQTAMLPDGLADNYESLTSLTRLLLSVSRESTP